MIEVFTTWIEHEGGTKFYQVFEFRNNEIGGKNVTMTHWGSIAKLHADKFNRPVLGGETQIKHGRLASTTVASKRKRGYTIHDTRVAHGIAWWTEHFGAALTHDLMVAMGLQDGAEDYPIADPDTISKGEVPPAEPDVRPSAWGTW